MYTCVLWCVCACACVFVCARVSGREFTAANEDESQFTTILGSKLAGRKYAAEDRAKKMESSDR